MKVATKILIFNLFAVCIIIFVFFAVCSVILVDSFHKLEEKNVKVLMDKARNEIDKDIITLDANTMVYAYWNETYLFAQGMSENYALDAIPHSTFENLGINAIIIINATGDVIFRLAYEKGYGELPLPRGFLPHFRKNSSILTHDYSKGGIMGYIMVDGEPYIISSRPILKNNQEGPSMGIFVMAKRMDFDYMQSMSASSGIDLHLYGVDRTSTLPYLDEIGMQELMQDATKIVPITEDSIVAYRGLRDIYGDMNLALSADIPRELSQQASQSQTTLLVLTAVLGFGLIALTIYLLRVIVLNRLERLDDDVRRIGRSGSTQERLLEEGNDELSNLASSINRMLAALSSSEADLIRSKKRYEAIVQDQNELVLRTSPDLKITFVNLAFCSFFGFDRLSAIGRDLPFPQGQNDIEMIKTVVSRLNPDKPVGEIEMKVISSQGEIRWLQWSVRGIFEEDSKLTEVQWVGRDVTEQKRMIEHLNQTEKIESLGVLAGGIAHDFNNMLTSILGTITMMRLSMEPSDPRYSRLEESERIIMRATELTHQLLTFSRGGEPIKKPVFLPRFAHDAALFALHGSDLVLEEHLDPATRHTEADEGQLFQVISNLVLNARQAMPKSGKIVLRCGNIDISPDSDSMLPPGNYVYLDVVDDGVGIPTQNLKKIFDPYFSTKPNGNGLGLTIVHSIVKKHGGEVEVQSEEGEGSCFRVLLPSIDSSEVREERTYSVSQASGRLLLMDDEESILEVTGALLQEYGYEVICAKDGEEALRLLREQKLQGKRIDLAILDLTIRGGLGGKDVVRTMKSEQEGLMAIVSSGYSNDPVMANYRDYGFDAVVQKPYRIMDMVMAIEELRARGKSAIDGTRNEGTAAT